MEHVSYMDRDEAAEVVALGGVTDVGDVEAMWRALKAGASSARREQGAAAHHVEHTGQFGETTPLQLQLACIHVTAEAIAEDRGNRIANLAAALDAEDGVVRVGTLRPILKKLAAATPAVEAVVRTQQWALWLMFDTSHEVHALAFAKCGHIEDLAVPPSLRGKGRATALLRMLTAARAELGLLTAARVESGDAPSLRLMKRAKWVQAWQPTQADATHASHAPWVPNMRQLLRYQDEQVALRSAVAPIPEVEPAAAGQARAVVPETPYVSHAAESVLLQTRALSAEALAALRIDAFFVRLPPPPPRPSATASAAQEEQAALAELKEMMAAVRASANE